MTAAPAKAIHDDLERCVKGVGRVKSALRLRREARERTDLALEIEMKPEDPRWLDFIEQVPEDVELEGGLPGRLTARCEPSDRAESYVVEAQIIGQDSEFRTVATVQDPLANLTFPPGSRVKVRFIARNSTGASAPSEVVEATVPQAPAASHAA